MKKILLLTVVMIAASLHGHAQQGTTAGRIRLADFQLQYGLSSARFQHGALEDFRATAPGSEIANMDLSGYDEQHFGILSTSSLAHFTVMLGLDLHKADGGAMAGHPQVRLGLGYCSMGSVGNYFFRSSEMDIDTLISPTSGQMMVVDSTTNDYVDMTYGANVLQLDASIRWRTSPEKRFSLYAGAGLSGGMSINSYTQLSHTQAIFIHYKPVPPGGAISNYFVGQWRSEVIGREVIKQQSEISWTACVPMGVDFRISKNNDFWNKIHVYTEFRPGLRGRMIPSFGNYISSTIFSGLGLRVDFH